LKASWPIEALLGSLALVAPQEFRRDRVGESQSLNGAGFDCPLCAFFVDDDTDDLDVGRHVGNCRVEILQHLFGVGHLGHGRRRDKRYCIDVFESGSDQEAQVVGLDLGGDGLGQPLPGVAGTLD
jgi:hypothetical protein